MDRRTFLKAMLLSPLVALFPDVLFAVARRPHWQNLLILVELKGGNDGLNTVIPYRDSNYYDLRPKLAVPRDKIIKLEDAVGFHPSLEKLAPIWHKNELAIVQGVGYPDPNLSHFRSIEIWESGSNPDEIVTDGWLSRLFTENPTPTSFAADGIIIGGQSLGPLTGLDRALVLPRGKRRMRRQNSEDRHHQVRPNSSLMHILKVKDDYTKAAQRILSGKPINASFPSNPFGNTLKRATQVVASENKVAVIKVSIGGFDTHANQSNPHTRILKELGEGLAALRHALIRLNRWNSTLIMTYSEFGRRPKQNMSLGTDHGTANVHFMLGGRVRGGLYGKKANLQRLENGNLPYSIDFRSMYATVIDKWWELDSYDVFGQRFPKLNIIKS